MTKINSKQCAKCQEVKPVGEFRRHADRKSGLYSNCRSCENEYNKNRNSTFEGKCKQAVRDARKQAKKYGVKSALTLAEVMEVLSGDSCDYCNAHLEQSQKSLEHIIPFESGGENTFGNVTMSCLDCNRKKRSVPAFEFMLLSGDADAGRRLIYALAERNGMEPQAYLYELARAGIEYRTARLYRIAGVER